MDGYREMRVDVAGPTPQVGWLKNIILVAVMTGLRLGELCSVTWGAVDFETGFVMVRNTDACQTKSGDERSVPPLAGDALTVLQRLDAEWRAAGRPGNTHVFLSAHGKALTSKAAQRDVSKKFKQYARPARLPEHVHFHSLRHTCASRLVQRGVSLPIVPAVLGHSSIQVTQRYAHLAPDVLTKAMRETFG